MVVGGRVLYETAWFSRNGGRSTTHDVWQALQTDIAASAMRKGEGQSGEAKALALEGRQMLAARRCSVQQLCCGGGGGSGK